MYTPYCPYCGARLEAEDVIDESYEGDYCDNIVYGNCPECNKNYIWKQRYVFSECLDLKEEREDD